MDSEFKAKKILWSLNLIHNILPYYGLTDECFDLMMYTCSKSRKLWKDKCSILASITLSDDKYWVEMDLNKELNNSQVEAIIKYHYHLKYSLTINCKSQDSLELMIVLLDSIKFIRLAKLRIVLNSACIYTYNQLVDILKAKNTDLSKMNVNLTDPFDSYGEFNYLPAADINSFKQLSFVKHIGCLTYQSIYNTQEVQSENKCIIDKISTNSINISDPTSLTSKLSESSKESIKSIEFNHLGYIKNSECLDYQHCVELSEEILFYPQLREVEFTLSNYAALNCIPIFTKYWIQPKVARMKEFDSNYKNELSIKYKHTKSILLPKLLLTLRNPTLGFCFSEGESYFITAELLEINLSEFSFDSDNQIIIVSNFKELKVKGCTVAEVQPPKMIEIMSKATLQ